LKGGASSPFETRGNEIHPLTTLSRENFTRTALFVDRPGKCTGVNFLHRKYLRTTSVTALSLKVELTFESTANFHSPSLPPSFLLPSSAMEAPLTADVVASILGLNDGSFEQKVSKYKKLVSFPEETSSNDPSCRHLLPFVPEFKSLDNIVRPSSCIYP